MKRGHVHLFNELKNLTNDQESNNTKSGWFRELNTKSGWFATVTVLGPF